MSINTVINTNVMALTSHRALTNVGNTLSKASERLSTGLRINRAADDAAGLAISEKMRSQIRGLDQAARNANDGISLIQTAEGALQETHEMMQRMRELVVQASSDALDQNDRDKIALELDELSKEIQETSSRTEFNTKKLIDGSWENQKLYIQVGANALQGLEFNIAGMSADSIGVNIKDIGDIVRGKFNTSVSNQELGTAAIQGEYNVDLVNGLGIVSSASESYDMDFVSNVNVSATGPRQDAAEGVFALDAFKGDAAANYLTFTNDGNVTVTGNNVDYTDTLGNTVSLNDGDILTKDELAGKTFTSSDGLTSITFAKDATDPNKINATKTEYALEATEKPGFAMPADAAYTVNGIDLTVSGSGTDVKVTTGQDLYAFDGTVLAEAGDALDKETTYYDSNGVTLFSTSVTDPSKLTVYEPETERNVAFGQNVLAGTGVILTGGATGVNVNPDSATTVYRMAGAGETPNELGLVEVKSNNKLDAGNYYDASGNILFSLAGAGGAMTVTEYVPTELKMNTTSSAEITVADGSSADGIKFDFDSGGGRITDLGGMTIKNDAGAVNANDALAAGDYYNSTTGELLFSVSGTDNQTVTTYKSLDVSGSPIDLTAANSGLIIGGVTITEDGSGQIFADQALYTAPDGSTGEITAGTDLAGVGGLATGQTYYDKDGNALFTTNDSTETTIDTIYSAAATSADVTDLGTNPYTQITGSVGLGASAKYTLAEPATDTLAAADLTIKGQTTADGKNIYSVNTVGTKNIVRVAKEGDPITGTPLGAGDQLLPGVYYDQDTGDKVFSVNNDGNLITEYAPSATPTTTESAYYTPASSVKFAIQDDGRVAICGDITLTNSNGDTKELKVGQNVKVEDLAGWSITDAANNTQWAFEKINDPASAANGKMQVTKYDITNPSNPVQQGASTIITKTLPYDGIKNEALADLAKAGANLGGFALDANGALSVTSPVTATDGTTILPAGYDFGDPANTDHLGKTFEIKATDKDGKEYVATTISFGAAGEENEGKVSITSGYVRDTIGMNETAKAAYEKFVTDMQGVLNSGGSNGKVISLLTDRMDAAIEIVSSQRAQLGAYQNRLEHTIKSLEISSENLSSAESRIRDADMAKEMMNYTKSNILQQAAISMLAQANQMPQNILQLLR